MSSFESEFLKSKNQILHTSNIYFTRIDKKLDAIMDLIKRNPSSNVKPPTLDSTFLEFFPLNDLESLIVGDTAIPRKSKGDFVRRQKNVFKKSIFF